MEENRCGVTAEPLKLWAQIDTRASGPTTSQPTNAQLLVSKGMWPWGRSSWF